VGKTIKIQVVTTVETLQGKEEGSEHGLEKSSFLQVRARKAGKNYLLKKNQDRDRCS